MSDRTEVNGVVRSHRSGNNPDALRAAVAALLELLAESKERHVRVEEGGLRALLAVESLEAITSEPARNTPKPAYAGQGKFFSFMEETIMGATTKDWQTRQEIADKTGFTASSQFSVLMSNLAERGCLESGNRGYRLPPEDNG
jgi:hypothetical protein